MSLFIYPVLILRNTNQLFFLGLGGGLTTGGLLSLLCWNFLLFLDGRLGKLDLDFLDFVVDESVKDSFSKSASSEGSSVRSVNSSRSLRNSVEISTSNSLQTTDSFGSFPLGGWSFDLLSEVLSDKSST